MCSILICFILTIVIKEWCTKYKKEINKLDNAMIPIAIDSLLNFKTVEYLVHKIMKLNNIMMLYKNEKKVKTIFLFLF